MYICIYTHIHTYTYIYIYIYIYTHTYMYTASVRPRACHSEHVTLVYMYALIVCGVISCATVVRSVSIISIFEISI